MKKNAEELFKHLKQFEDYLETWFLEMPEIDGEYSLLCNFYREDTNGVLKNTFESTMKLILGSRIIRIIEEGEGWFIVKIKK